VARFPTERAGRIDQATPKLRKGSYFPSFLELRRTAEKALVALDHCS
jgi:transposase-like protein